MNSQNILRQCMFYGFYITSCSQERTALYTILTLIFCSSQVNLANGEF